MDEATPGWVYKILRPHEWQQFLSAGTFEGSPDDRRDGFIHLSSGAQVPGTLDHHYAKDAEVVLVRIAADAPGGGLRWEPSRNGSLFPHLYRPLRLGEVSRTTTLRRGPSGFDARELPAPD